MKIYDEIIKIAQKNQQIENLITRFADKSRLIEVENFDFSSAEFVSGISVKGKYLYKDGERIAEESNDCYVDQKVGYCDGDCSWYDEAN